MSHTFFMGAPALISLLPGESLALLLRDAETRTYSRGEQIYAGGDVRPSLDIVRQGAVRLGNPRPDGQQAVSAVAGVGHCFGEHCLFDGQPRTFDAWAVGETELASVPADAYHALAAAHPEIGRAVATVLARRFGALLGFLDDLRRLPLNVTVAKLLIRMFDNRIHDAAIAANPAELAAMLGLSPVALAPVLSRLERDGLVQRLHGRVELRDRAKMQVWVDQRSAREPMPAAGTAKS